MDLPEIVAVDPSGVNSEKLIPFVGEKRPVEDDGDGELGLRLGKKVRDDSDGGMKRIAEIVLVLSTMGKIRCGRAPIDVEKGLMVEAREKLAELCESLAPKDIIPRDAVNGVVEDLGLIKLRDQRSGFRPPKLSIAEKLLLTKRKMEESKEFALRSAICSSQRLQAGYGATAESHGILLHTYLGFSIIQTSSTSMFPVGFQLTSPVYVSAAANEISSAMISRGLYSSHQQRDSSSLALPRTETAHVQLDGRSNGLASASQVQANSSNDRLEKTPICSLQLQSALLAKVAQETKVSGHTPAQVEGTPDISASQISLQATRYETSEPTVIQSLSEDLPGVHQPLQDMNFVYAPSIHTNHDAIARDVQKFLLPKLPEHINWTPPSRDYMIKALFCQICKVTINDVESLLVCDACEKGVHLKCLQTYNRKGVPRGEWHCPRCLISSNGKPLPPKYGRVTRNVNAPKVSSDTTGVPASLEKKVENSVQKVSHQKITGNRNPGSLNHTQVGNTGCNNIEPVADSRIPNSREIMQKENFSASRLKINDGAYCGTSLDGLKETSEALCVSPLSGTPHQQSTHHIQNKESCHGEERSIFGSKPQPLTELSETGSDTCHLSRVPCNSQDADRKVLLNSAELSSKQSSIEDTSNCKMKCDIEQGDENFAQSSSDGTSRIGNGTTDCSRSPSDGWHCVVWVGDLLQVVDDKTFYESCCINGVVYKLQDHALFCSKNGSLMPSKLQALWEDNKTRSKCAIVNRYYLPTDLPEVVDRPCKPENNEVYESNHDSTIMAGLIQGPCNILYPEKLKEESEKGNHFKHEPNDGLQPVFLCKWFYDESERLFRPFAG